MNRISLAVVASAFLAATGAQAAPQSTALASEGGRLASTCAGCHGQFGQLSQESFMPLAGMPKPQFVRAMKEFRDGKRPATLMGIVAVGFTDGEIDAMADYYVGQTPLPLALPAKQK